MTKSVTILGSTGSIGTSTLALLAASPEKFRVHALVAGSNSALLAEQAKQFRPAVIGIDDEAELPALRAAMTGYDVEIVAGTPACTDIAAAPVDIVIAGIVGLAGLGSVMTAAAAGQTIGLANKESLVSAGGIVTATAARNGARLLPLDSEHSAVFQCWQGWAGHSANGVAHADRSSIDHICLTASGGPFRQTPLKSFPDISPADAVKHPNWDMGQKISVDSATMMNKGLEVIEAAWLFDLPAEKIDVLIHPQVVIHAMVYFKDGSVISQLASADMKTPISYALAWPDRLDWSPDPLDLAEIATLDFYRVEPARYPCFALARQALNAGGIMPAVLNAANEIAVAAFLEGRIIFTQIAPIVDAVCAAPPDGDVDSLDAVLALDQRARDQTMTIIRQNQYS